MMVGALWLALNCLPRKLGIDTNIFPSPFNIGGTGDLLPVFPLEEISSHSSPLKTRPVMVLLSCPKCTLFSTFRRDNVLYDLFLLWLRDAHWDAARSTTNNQYPAICTIWEEQVMAT